MIGRTLRAWFVLLALPLSAAGGQQRPVVYQYPLAQLDLAIMWDTTSGVQLLAVPSLTTKEGRDPRYQVWLRFHPDSVADWLGAASATLRQAVSGGPARGSQWSPVLRGRHGRGQLALGRERKNGRLDNPRWLAVSDSGPGFRVPLREEEADSIIKLLFLAASSASLDTTPRAPADRDEVDRPVAIESQPTPSWPRQPGRVIMQFVVGPDGRGEPESVVVLLASSKEHAEGAREVILHSRFRPAERHGEPVRQRVQQTVVWHAP